MLPIVAPHAGTIVELQMQLKSQCFTYFTSDFLWIFLTNIIYNNENFKERERWGMFSEGKNGWKTSLTFVETILLKTGQMILQ